MALGLALLLTVTHNGNFTYMALNWDNWLQGNSGTGWNPKGVIKFADQFWGGPPPETFTARVYWLSIITCLTMILGILTPVSQVLATLSAVYLVSLQTSFGPYWSHAYNVQLLAALAFMFSRHSGDVLSVDALIRKLRRLPARDYQGSYWWPVIYAELATAMFMFGAFFQKFRETGVYWALSDNIRNSLIVTWFQYRSDPPPIALWLASEPLVWKTAGLLQLFAQATTILAAFLIARPVFRLLFGAGFFAAEILALGHIFRFWHPFWAPLCLLSIDFEHFYRLLKRRPSQFTGGAVGLLFQHRIEKVGEKSAPANKWRIPIVTFGLVFFGYYLATLAYRLGETHLNYPFSTMGFYSVTRDRPPFGEHHYYPIYTGRIDAYGAGEQDPVALWYREGALEDNLFRVNTIDHLKAIHQSYLKRAKNGLYMSSRGGAEGFDLRPFEPVKVVYRAGLMAVPPFPQTPGMVDFHMGYRAVYDDRGFRAIVARTVFDKGKNLHYVTVEAEGFAAPVFRILTSPGGKYADEISQPVAMSGHWEGDRFYITQAFDEEFTLVEVTDSVLNVQETYYGADVF